MNVGLEEVGDASADKGAVSKKKKKKKKKKPTGHNLEDGDNGESAANYQMPGVNSVDLDDDDEIERQRELEEQERKLAEIEEKQRMLLEQEERLIQQE